MKLFLDTAQSDALEKWAFLIDGVTTNPTSLSQEGSNPTLLIQKICKLFPSKDISVEITEKTPNLALAQARKIASIANNVTVKVPCHQIYYPVIHQLVKENIRVNVTLIFSLIQAVYMCKMGVTYISPFVGRLDELDTEGTTLLYEIRQAIDHYAFETQIIAASIRHIRHIHEALCAGADIITLSPKVLEQSMKHILTDTGIAQFDTDWQKIGVTQFP